MKKIFILLFAVILYGLNADAQFSNNSNGSLDSNTTCIIYTQEKVQKRELDNGNISYISKQLNTNVILHPYISKTDKAYVDYIFSINNQKIGNIRFNDNEVDNFTDFGDELLFKCFNQIHYVILKYYAESEYTYYFIVEIDKNKIKKIYQSRYQINRYIPEKLLKQDKYLPITYTMYEKDGGLYMKVGSTYKSDIITLKKPKSGK